MANYEEQRRRGRDELCPAPSIPPLFTVAQWREMKWEHYAKNNPSQAMYWTTDALQRWYDEQCAAITAEYIAYFEAPLPKNDIWRDTLDAISFRASNIGVPPPILLWTKAEWEKECKQPYPENPSSILMNVTDKNAYELGMEFAHHCTKPAHTILVNVGIDKKDDPMESRIAFCWLSLVNGRFLPHYGESLLHEFDPRSFMFDLTSFHCLL